MTDESNETERPGQPDEQQPLGRSHYEDFDLSQPSSPVAIGRRSPTLWLAVAVLGFGGLQALTLAFLLPVSGSVRLALGVLGALDATTAVLVAMLRPIGRPLGIAMGCLGLVLGLLSARSSPANGLVSIGLNGFVIYALASSGPAFRRE